MMEKEQRLIQKKAIQISRKMLSDFRKWAATHQALSVRPPGIEPTWQLERGNSFPLRQCWCQHGTSASLD